jgi:RNA polymerase sigma-70 factor (ECF subfamily)
MPNQISPAPRFEDLVERYSQEILNYLWRLTQDVQDAEDLLQDTFLRAFRAYPNLEHHEHLRAWLYKIATNNARTFHQRNNQHQRSTARFDEEYSASSDTTAAQVQSRLDLSAVKAAVEALPLKQRSALIMHKYQALSYREIASALDIQEDAVRANVYQAMKKLKAAFSEKEV